MNPPWWGIVVVLVVGVAVVWYGWAADRRRHRTEVEAARRPTREIPGLPAHEAPRYVLQSDLAGLTVEPSSVAADEALLGRRDEAATLPAGAAEGAFLNRADRGLAVLDHPDVLVLGGDLTADRDTTGLLVAAKRRGRPLVIVAPFFADGTLATLRANALAGTVRTLPVPLEDATARRRAVALTGGRLVSAADLTAGWLPPESWGSCDGWIADLDDSWVLVAGRHPAESAG
nr:hypothetical protein [Propionibacterium sp.]